MNKTNNLAGSAELRVAYQIKRHLNSSLDQVSPEKLERLRAAREQALAKQKRSSSLAVAGGGSFSFASFGFGLVPQVVPLLVLLAGLLSMSYWHQNRYSEELADIDTQVLVDELPPSAYVDRGFDSWLKRDTP
jgi:hypothetical protein